MTQQAHSFSQSGRIFAPAQHGNEVKTLPAGVYTVKFNPQSGFYFEAVDPMTMPSKMYGETTDRAKRVLNTYLERRGKNTGVLLTGNKGSGKTLLSKDICVRAVELGMPIILIEDAYTGTSFVSFMNELVQDAVVFIDEFEKKYTKPEEQNDLLSLLDGTGAVNKLYILTSNSEKVSEFLLSRPSRLFYHWKYGKLDLAVLEGYCEDNLTNKEHLRHLVTLYEMSDDMSFDILQALVEELNRYPTEEFVDVIMNMNVTIGGALARHYKTVSVVIGSETFTPCEDTNYVRLNVLDTILNRGRIQCRFDLNNWEIQKKARSFFGTIDTQWFNWSISENKELTDKQIEEENMYDEDFTFNFAFNPDRDELNSESITMVRDMDGTPVVITMEVMKALTQRDYFSSLFK